ncbi:hypothetical protein BC628DRAFT_1197236 [Trametes gibbosa]|nr:hypothetical protein BC628DRAFT_1197236 [Trametes gibbosa]
MPPLVSNLDLPTPHSSPPPPYVRLCERTVTAPVTSHQSPVTSHQSPVSTPRYNQIQPPSPIPSHPDKAVDVKVPSSPALNPPPSPSRARARSTPRRHISTISIISTISTYPSVQVDSTPTRTSHGQHQRGLRTPAAPRTSFELPKRDSPMTPPPAHTTLHPPPYTSRQDSPPPPLPPSHARAPKRTRQPTPATRRRAHSQTEDNRKRGIGITGAGGGGASRVRR